MNISDTAPCDDMWSMINIGHIKIQDGYLVVEGVTNLRCLTAEEFVSLSELFSAGLVTLPDGDGVVLPF